jgi:hypothetical protein
MTQLSPSNRIYIALILILALLAAIQVFLPMGSLVDAFPQDQLPASKPVLALANAAIMLILYGGLGFFGLKLSKKLGYAELWDAGISNKQRLLIPALVGISLGVFIILADLFFGRFHSLGPIPHPPFPTSIVVSATAAIGEELLFRLFFISFWVWLVCHVILKKRLENRIFWIVTMLSALAFGAVHIIPAPMLFGLKTVSEMPLAFVGEFILLNGIVSVLCAYYFRKFGFLAAVGIHFWTDVIWHVVWGLA